MGRWRLINARVLTERLANESEATRSNIAVLVECILAEPYDPPGIEAHPLRGREDEGFLVAYLGEGWHLTYRPRQLRQPPLMGNHVEVHALVRLFIDP